MMLTAMRSMFVTRLLLIGADSTRKIFGPSGDKEEISYDDYGFSINRSKGHS